MKKKSKSVLFSEPAISDRQLLVFLHFRLTKIDAEIQAIKEIITENIGAEKLATIAKLSEHHFDEAMKAYECEAKKFFERSQERPMQN